MSSTCVYATIVGSMLYGSRQPVEMDVGTAIQVLQVRFSDCVLFFPKNSTFSSCVESYIHIK